MRTSDFIDRLNYLNDPRVIARDTPGAFASFDTRTMTGTVTTYDDDGHAIEHELHGRMEVCDTCSGRGTHTNPSIDAGGYDFDGDDVDEETGESHYLSGRYDVACYECKGRRVVPVPVARTPADEAVLAQLAEYAQQLADSRAEQRAEWAMGA